MLRLFYIKNVLVNVTENISPPAKDFEDSTLEIYQI